MFEHVQTRVMEGPQDLGAGSRGHRDEQVRALSVSLG